MSTKLDALKELPNTFAPNWQTLAAVFFPSFIFFGLSLAALNESDSVATIQALAGAIIYYLAMAYLVQFDLSTRCKREDSVIVVTSWLPGMSRNIDLRKASLYFYAATRFSSRLTFLTHSGEKVGSVPRSVFKFEALEKWAQSNLKVMKY